MTVAHLILFATLALASWTDIRRHHIPNFVTYPALAACLLAAALQEGHEGLTAALLGSAACGGLMLLAWLASAVGGGDVKLAAVMGSALGWTDGLYALMWTFTFAAIWMLSSHLWRDGFRTTLAQLRPQALPDPTVPFTPATAPPTARPMSLAPAALAAVALILITYQAVVRNSQGRLSPLEARLVGEWTWNPGGTNRIFRPDRSFLTSNGQFEGTWSIDDNRLTIKNWEPFRIREIYNVDSLLFRLRKIGKTDTGTWDIEFSDDGQTHTLIYPENHERNPGGRWQWMRRPDK